MICILCHLLPGQDIFGWKRLYWGYSTVSKDSCSFVNWWVWFLFLIVSWKWFEWQLDIINGICFLTTGAIAIIVANPTDLVKVRLQSEGKLPAGVPRRYAGAVDAYFTIVKLVSKQIFKYQCQNTRLVESSTFWFITQEGVSALWTGLGPNIARNAIVNAAELASYDQIKEVIFFFSLIVLLLFIRMFGFYWLVV